MSETVHVAVAVIRDDHGRVLIARRPNDKHMGGYWEFPGGKVENNESVFEALLREIQEEVNLTIAVGKPLIQIPWQYPKKRVLLDVFECPVVSGEARGCEDQEIKWLHVDELGTYAFPPANKGIFNALRLPDKLLITGAADSEQAFLKKLDRAVENDIHLIQLRDLPFLNNSIDTTAVEFLEKLEQRYAHLDRTPVFLLNVPLEAARKFCLKYLHLKSRYLTEASLDENFKTDLKDFSLVSASVHNEEELELANQFNLDFILASPVQATNSHPGVKALGWDGLEQLVQRANMPVYALGGLAEEDLTRAKSIGAHGIAAISAFWK